MVFFLRPPSGNLLKFPILIFPPNPTAMTATTAKAKDGGEEDAAARRVARRLFSRGVRGRLTLAAADGNLVFGDGDPAWPEAAMTLPSAFRLALMSAVPDPVFLDGYVRGWWELKAGEMEDLMLVAAAAGRGADASGGWKQWTRVREGALRLRFLARQAAAAMGARGNVSRHYDIGDDLYFSFLDPAHLQYSCAFFRDGDDLAAAQENKLAVTFQRLEIPPRGRVLDIGGGWGGLVRALARRFPEARATGITLSENQLRHAQAAAESLPPEAGGRMEFHLEDYARHCARRAGFYDRIVSVGMFEHVPLPRRRGYFRAIARALAPGGRALVHSIARPSPGAVGIWIDRNIFPGGCIPSLSEMLAAAEKSGLRVADVFIHAGTHYQRTLRAWRENYRANRHGLSAEKYPAAFHRMWEAYFAACAYVFDARGDGYRVAQMVLEKEGGN